jgi:hypothetical protein
MAVGATESVMVHGPNHHTVQNFPLKFKSPEEAHAWWGQCDLVDHHTHWILRDPSRNNMELRRFNTLAGARTWEQGLKIKIHNVYYNLVNTPSF